MPASNPGSRGYEGMAVFGSIAAVQAQGTGQGQAQAAHQLPGLSQQQQVVIDLTGRSSPDGTSRGGGGNSRHSNGTGLEAASAGPMAAAAAVAAAARLENEAVARQLHGARAEGTAALKRAEGAEKRASAAEQRALEAEARLAAATSATRRAEEDLERTAVGYRAALSRALLREATLDREATRQALQADAPRIGRMSVQRQGTSLVEMWEEGTAHRDLEGRAAALAEEKAAVERARKALRKRHLPPPAAGARVGSAAAAAAASAASGEAPLSDAEFLAADALVTARLETLKKQERVLEAEQARLKAEKEAHIREVLRQRDEEGSRLGNLGRALGADAASPRYVLNRMLGKGGFSEVFKAYDLFALHEVAVKVHQLDSNWSEARKSAYVRHAVREYNIHKVMDHPNICELRDIFEVDASTFATVLEHCPGGDLDSHLKASKDRCLPEKEARAIIVAVFAGLLYLADRPKPIIHYDLKPGNILFGKGGQVKITDFGLSKIMEDTAATSMELTSQGAGTYWYLPPECFETGPTRPKVSSKVDVWSAGCVLYQMLFGKRPFAHDMSQESILRNDAIRKARTLEFPDKPAVSQAAKDLISRCLIRDVHARPDMKMVVTDPYLDYAALPDKQLKAVSSRGKAGAKAGAVADHAAQ